MVRLHLVRIDSILLNQMLLVQNTKLLDLCRCCCRSMHVIFIRFEVLFYIIGLKVSYFDARLRMLI